MNHFRPDGFDCKYDHDTNDYEETSFPGTTISLQKELVQFAVDSYYNAMTKQGYTPALGHAYSKFELVGGRLWLKAH